MPQEVPDVARARQLLLRYSTYIHPFISALFSALVPDSALPPMSISSYLNASKHGRCVFSNSCRYISTQELLRSPYSSLKNFVFPHSLLIYIAIQPWFWVGSDPVSFAWLLLLKLNNKKVPLLNGTH